MENVTVYLMGKKYEVPSNLTIMTAMEYAVGDVVRLKKKHPCGSFEWEILRVGADFRLKCLGCGHQIMIPRKNVEKNIKEIRKEH